MSRFRWSVIALFSLCLYAYGEKGPEKQAKVISQNITTVDDGLATMAMGYAVRTVPVVRQYNIIVVETDRYRTTMVEEDRKNLIVPVNSTVMVYQDGDHIVIIGDKGKKFKFRATHVEQLEPNRD